MAPLMDGYTMTNDYTMDGRAGFAHLDSLHVEDASDRLAVGVAV